MDARNRFPGITRIAGNGAEPHAYSMIKGRAPVGTGRAITRKTSGKLPVAEFVKGQIWQTPEAYILITEVGKLLIHYRLGSRPEVQSKARISSKEDVRAYLQKNDGVLFKSEG